MIKRLPIIVKSTISNLPRLGLLLVNKKQSKKFLCPLWLADHSLLTDQLVISIEVQTYVPIMWQIGPQLGIIPATFPSSIRLPTSLSFVLIGTTLTLSWFLSFLFCLLSMHSHQKKKKKKKKGKKERRRCTKGWNKSQKAAQPAFL